MPIITLTSDLGIQDYYLAAIKGTLVSNFNNIQVVDITHQIPNFDIFKAAETLSHTFHFFPEGTIHCVLVNTQSHLKAPILLGKYKGHYFIGPDNGLFSFLFEEVPEQLLSLNENSNVLKSTFPFLDLYLPGLKALIQGNETDLMGSEVTEYVMKNPFNSFGQEDTVHGYIWHVDKFGNCISNINRPLFDRVGKGQAFLIDIKGHQATSMITHYDEKSGGAMLVFFNFLGLLEFAISNGSATQLLGLNRNDKVIIRFGKAI
jgi:S-adenosylmethionine hydrolase